MARHRTYANWSVLPEICIGDHFNECVLCPVSGKPVRVLFMDAVKFQAGWYHGLYLNYQARPEQMSGRAFCLYTNLYDRYSSVLSALSALHSSRTKEGGTN